MIRSLIGTALVVSLVACGGDPPAKNPNDQLDAPPTVEQGGGHKGGGAGGPQVGQELGSMDQRAVEKMFNNLLNGPLEKCHQAGRGRIDYLSGDVKLFTRVSAEGTVKYGYFEDSTIGDRDTEKCVLDALKNAAWPKPIGGEGEVRNAMSWTPGSERQPSPWAAEKVTGALDNAANKAIKAQVETCKAGTSGFKVTAYVEPGELEPAAAAEPEPKGGKKPPGKPDPKKKGKPAEPEAEHGGKFKAIGMAAPNKDAAEKIDCLVDALKQLPLPSPGSYAAKVSFTL
jgi:hypothetical protein